AALIFLAGLLPVLGLVPFLMQYYSTVTDHYMYLPMFGAALGVAWVVSRYERRWVYVVSAVVLMIFAVLSFIEAGYWQTELTLSQHTIAVNERSFAGHTSLANALVRRGRDGEAAVHFRRAMEINPDYASAYEGYSQLLMRAGKVDEATEYVRKYIQAVSTYPEYARPDIAGAYTNLGNALLARGKYEEAIGEFEKALKIDPKRAKAQEGLRQAREKLSATRPTTRP
ncbi:MAG TPA: tetratricopeptide repeat protein, partial [Tepidisphaeraceae bacterium]|nr:tetratricopeptide repeat protein [Tepidisphaeraceae bacterium]